MTKPQVGATRTVYRLDFAGKKTRVTNVLQDEELLEDVERKTWMQSEKLRCFVLFFFRRSKKTGGRLVRED